MQAEKKDGKAALNTLIIKDSPDFKRRGVMLDSSRNFFEPDDIKALFDNMFFLKLNTFHWHLSDDQGFRIESESYPLLNSVGSKREHRHLKGYGLDNDGVEENRYYTKEQIRELVEYADARNIQIIPEIDLPGHTCAILASYPELSCNGEKSAVMTTNGISDAILCAGNEKVFEFLDTLFEEICPLFPCEYFHIGGDEAFKGYKIWEKCEKCNSVKEKNSICSNKDLQIYFMNRVNALLKKHGKHCISWDDCVGDKLDKDIDCQLWRTSATANVRKQSFERDITASPTSHFYFDYTYSVTSLKKVYKFNKFKLGFTDSRQRLSGLECEVWTEFIDTRRALEYSLYPRLNAFAEVSWTLFENRRYKDFYKRLAWYKTYMRHQNINYSRIEKGIDFFRKSTYNLGEDGKEFKKNDVLINRE
ncbi:MAG: hypothetical protein E7514_02095 [Ruminococcaceae bacterium]|nr:hypothetical protein [Oscillospiraceae bacterium]